ncbi:SGNH/GDSL hydrolase family protein [Arthrobacter sp. C152]
MRKVARVLLFPLLFFLAFAAAQPAAAATYPRSMAALGDSISRAADVCCWYGDHPAQSWSTGSASYDGIQSHYERLLPLRPAISGNNFNDARSGAKAKDLPAQAATAASQKAEYVTILVGANDLCTSSAATMTDPAAFRTSVEQSMAALNQMSPKPRVFMASIPNIYQLWSVLHTNSVAQWVWSSANICQSMLSSANTDADRQAVRDRENAFNAILADVCQSTYKNICRWDNGAVFNYSFSAGDVSVLDYFHPSLQGQAKLASITWGASYWGS